MAVKIRACSGETDLWPFLCFPRLSARARGSFFSLYLDGKPALQRLECKFASYFEEVRIWPEFALVEVSYKFLFVRSIFPGPAESLTLRYSASTQRFNSARFDVLLPHFVRISCGDFAGRLADNRLLGFRRDSEIL